MHILLDGVVQPQQSVAGGQYAQRRGGEIVGLVVAPVGEVKRGAVQPAEVEGPVLRQRGVLQSDPD